MVECVVGNWIRKFWFISYLLLYIHCLKLSSPFYLRSRNELNPFSMILLIFKAFCTFCFRYITSPSVSHLSTNYIFQNKPVKNYYYNLWKYEEYRKNNNQGRTIDENITNIAFGYGKHLWMISIEIWLLFTYLLTVGPQLVKSLLVRISSTICRTNWGLVEQHEETF